MIAAMKRQLFLNINRFQRPILYLTVAATFVTIVILAICVSFLSYDIANMIINSTKEIPTTKLAVSLVLMILPISYLVIIYFSLRISNKMVGSMERILKELDEIIEKREKKHLAVRKGDGLVQELLKRINVLIDKMN